MRQTLMIDDRDRAGRIALAVGDQFDLHDVDVTSDEIQLMVRKARNSAQEEIDVTVNVRGREWRGQIAPAIFDPSLASAMSSFDEWLEQLHPIRQ